MEIFDDRLIIFLVGGAKPCRQQHLRPTPQPVSRVGHHQRLADPRHRIAADKRWKVLVIDSALNV